MSEKLMREFQNLLKNDTIISKSAKSRAENEAQIKEQKELLMFGTKVHSFYVRL